MGCGMKLQGLGERRSCKPVEEKCKKCVDVGEKMMDAVAATNLERISLA
jgi:hypothetical protein